MLVKRRYLLCLVLWISLTTEKIAAVENVTVAGEAKILILGAGMAGISAAKSLKDQGVENFIIIEATNRIGGRAKNTQLGDYEVELGCTWVQGVVGNPVYELVQKYNITHSFADFEDYIVRKRDGTDCTDDYDEAYERFEEALAAREHYAEILLKEDRDDMSIRAAFRSAGWNPIAPEEMMTEIYDIDFELGESPDVSGVKYADDLTYVTYSDEDYITHDAYGGYSKVVSGLADEIINPNDSRQRLFLNSPIKKIEQNDSHVLVYTENNKVFIGERVIVTFSLGVLQSRNVEFAPELPPWKWDSIVGFTMANYLHIYLQFPTMFWDDVEYIMHAHEKRGYFPIIVNRNKHYNGSNIIQFQVFENEAVRLSRMSLADVQAEAMTVLRGMYGNNIPDPIRIAMPDWLDNPYFMGMYSNWPVGYSNYSFEALSAAVGRVHFGGEHTSEKYFGYLHGAYSSGPRVAGDVLACLKDECPAYKPFYERKGCTSNIAENFDDEALVDDGSCKMQKLPCTATAPQTTASILVLFCFFISALYN